VNLIRRQLVLRALFEIRGAFPEDMQKLLDMNSVELEALFAQIEKALQDASVTLPPGQF
jgi:hypothetical protein